MSYVLVLETDSVLRQEIAELFISERYEVFQEADSGAGVAHIMRRKPGVIIMSEDFPPLGGVGMLPLLRRLTAAPIVVQGVGGEVPAVKALLEGADVYLRRPVNPIELLVRVRSLLGFYPGGRTAE